MTMDKMLETNGEEMAQLSINLQISSQCTTLVELLQKRALQQGDQMAYAFLSNGEEVEASLTYGELDRRVRAVAAHLQQLAAPGERAILLYQASLDYVIAYLGCLYAGLIAVPAYPPHPKRPMTRIQAILQDARATVALTTSEIFTKLQPRFATENELGALHWIVSDTIEEYQADHWRSPTITGDTLAFLQYTSGSTNTPKGVMITHANLLSTLLDIDRAAGHNERSVLVSWLPIFHDLGLIYGILTPLYHGFRCYFFDPVHFLQNPLRWLAAISRYRGTHSAAPNFAYDLCTQRISPEERATLDLRSWQVGYNAAEPVRADTLRNFVATFASAGLASTVICPAYGLAEASVKVSTERYKGGAQLRTLRADALEQNQIVDAQPNDNNVRQIVGCGQSSIDAAIRIVDPVTLSECSPDQIGEIWVASPSVAQGYWNRPEATAETFHAYLANSNEGPFMRTGDLGFLYHGDLYVTGRIKDLLIIRGRNHYPQDIELTVEQSSEALRPGCGAAFSITVEGEERLVIAQEVQRTHLRRLDVDAVSKLIQRAITAEHDLQAYTILLLEPGGVLKTSSGKLQRQATRKAFLENTLPIVGRSQQPLHTSVGIASRTLSSTNGQQSVTAGQIAGQIRLWLSQKLNQPLSAIDPHTPFADFGLDSVTAVELIQTIQDSLPTQLALEPTLTWNFPTIALISEYIATQLQTMNHAPPPDTSNGATTAPSLPQSTLTTSISGLATQDLTALSETDLVKLLAEEVALAQGRVVA